MALRTPSRRPQSLVRAITGAVFRALGSFVLRPLRRHPSAVRRSTSGLSRRARPAVSQTFLRTHIYGQVLPGPEEPFVMLAGYPFLVKGADLLVHAFTRLADKHPGWRLVLIGHELAQRLKEAGLELRASSACRKLQPSWRSGWRAAPFFAAARVPRPWAASWWRRGPRPVPHRFAGRWHSHRDRR